MPLLPLSAERSKWLHAPFAEGACNDEHALASIAHRHFKQRAPRKLYQPAAC